MLCSYRMNTGKSCPKIRSGHSLCAVRDHSESWITEDVLYWKLENLLFSSQQGIRILRGAAAKTRPPIRTYFGPRVSSIRYYRL
jgi:hypothetical protein